MASHPSSVNFYGILFLFIFGCPCCFFVLFFESLLEFTCFFTLSNNPFKFCICFSLSDL